MYKRQAYDTNLAFPLFGEVKIPILYLGLVVFMIPVMGNTINSIDVLNGVASGFTSIASFSLTIVLFILQNYEIGIIALCLAFASLGFYKYHKFPSRIFPGDSGALVFGEFLVIRESVCHELLPGQISPHMP